MLGYTVHVRLLSGNLNTYSVSLNPLWKKYQNCEVQLHGSTRRPINKNCVIYRIYLSVKYSDKEAYLHSLLNLIFWVILLDVLWYSYLVVQNKLSIVIFDSLDYQVGNREMNQLYTTSQVSNITRKTTFSLISWHVFQE